MPLPQTQIARPEWVAAQNPARWLTESEMTMWDSWPSEKRRSEWLAGRLAAKRLGQAEFSLDPLTCEIGRAGVAPYFLGPGLPFSYPLNFALSGDGRASWSNPETEGFVGIDAQRIRPVHAGLCRRVFTAEEQAQIAARFGTANDAAGMLLFWAAKEAAIKARRVPWGRALREISVQLSGEHSAIISVLREPAMTAEWTRVDDWWLVRAVRPIG